ncbi:MAG TPA: valine--tRNA ligase [Candidatus Dormibacteraeota bacterium]|nr:valine--tRNA ligase [Candidatus Dormibacteraeota bacterium]
MPAPDRPTLDGVEQRWARTWEERGTYRFDRTRPRPEVFSIDTPPLTVSGSLHIGHVFSFTHTDAVARYQRMRGRAVFYPVGWDDNGLPTERRAQTVFGVRCDPSLPYDPAFEPVNGSGRQVPVSRRNFIEVCERLRDTDEKAFEAVWRRLGLSVDWSLVYVTIGERARAAAQRAFLRNLRRGEAYLAEAPTLWDVSFQTAVAQAELEDRPTRGLAQRLRFLVDGAPVEVETTRPELLPACVAVLVHPDDAEHRHLVGRTARTPLFDVEVPVMAHHLARPERGTGVVMVCTFGDLTDVAWWRELSLPTRVVVTRDGRLTATPPQALGRAGRGAYAQLAGRSLDEARRRVVEMLAEAGDLAGPAVAVERPVKFYEQGDRPLEIITGRQWYLRNGSHDEGLRDRLIERGRELSWHPDRMRVRYENWVGGLQGDWLISRQRFFGVPIPVWFPLDGSGRPDHGRPIPAGEADLPVDPATAAPPGYEEARRGVPGGFAADPDVMDTWATSSLTPQIVCGWESDPDLWERTYPMDLRPQGQEIIRTWLFSSVLRAELELGGLPWRNAAISGWVLDPDHKKMSKSKGNVVVPIDLFERYGSDAVRYWAAKGRPGSDTTADEGQIRVGRRLAIKLLNASRFVLAAGEAGEGVPTEAVDQAFLTRVAGAVAEATEAFEDYDYTRALEVTEQLFWSFCDDYLELVKSRAYGDLGPEGAASARSTLRRSLSTLLRLLAPFLPFATEEVWSWWREGSIHLARWPEPDAPAGADARMVDDVVMVLAAIRRAKTEARLSMRAPVGCVRVAGPAAVLDRVRAALADLTAAGGVASWDWTPRGGEPAVEVRP